MNENYRLSSSGIVEIDELVLKRWFTPNEFAMLRPNRFKKDIEDFYSVEITIY